MVYSTLRLPSVNPIFTAIIKIVSTKIFVEIKLTPKVSHSEIAKATYIFEKYLVDKLVCC